MCDYFYAIREKHFAVYFKGIFAGKITFVVILILIPENAEHLFNDFIYDLFCDLQQI